MPQTLFESRALLLVLATATLAFGWVLLPFYDAVLWAVVLAVIFNPLQQRLALRLGGRGNLSALITLMVCLLVAILPVFLVGLLLMQEGTQLYQRINSGELDIAAQIAQIKDLLPLTLQRQLDRLGMGNLDGLRQRISSSVMQGSEFLATKAFSIGQDTFHLVVGFFIMLYLLFFFLRDGLDIVRRIRMAVPLGATHKRRLQLKFTRVVRATVKGYLVVALLQGTLGGLIFWALDIPGAPLWGVLMAFLSLLPAVGSGLFWAPVALYLLLSGSIWQGVVLLLFGVFVIGMVDNVLRPLLVGKDTRMPDYLVLLSTLGGVSLFGLNGFVIGPMSAALFLATWDLFSSARKQIQLP